MKNYKNKQENMTCSLNSNSTNGNHEPNSLYCLHALEVGTYQILRDINTTQVANVVTRDWAANADTAG